MTTLAYPLFTAIDGTALNFRLICNRSSKKTEYLTKIVTYGGVCQKSSNPRIILVGGTLPCERGHFKCTIHPPFSKESAFKISWVDDCLAERTLFDVKAYLLNSSPDFSRISFLNRMMDGTYKPPSLNEIPQDQSSDDEVVMVECLHGGDPAIHTIVKAACQRAFTLVCPVPVVEERHDGNRSQRTPTASDLSGPNDNSLSPSSPNSLCLNSVAHNSPNERGNMADSTSKNTLDSGRDSIPLLVNLPKQPAIPQAGSSRIPTLFSRSSSSSSDSDSPVGVKQLKTPEKKTRISQESSVSTKRDTTPENKTRIPQSALHSSKPEHKRSRVATRLSSSSDSNSPVRHKQGKTADKHTHVSQDSSVSSDSDLKFGPPPGAVIRASGIRQNTRQPYTKKEEITILKYIHASKKFTGINSNVIWREIDGKPGLEKRTWQSLKNHFIKAMLPNLEHYNIFTPGQIQQLRSKLN